MNAKFHVKIKISYKTLPGFSLPRPTENKFLQDLPKNNFAEVYALPLALKYFDSSGIKRKCHCYNLYCCHCCICFLAYNTNICVYVYYYQLTLQTLQGLQAAPGHLLLKTENGYQLVRVGPAPTQQGTPATQQVSANSLPTNAVVAAAAQGAQGTTTAYRLTTVPAVSRLNAHFTGPALTTIRKPAQVMHNRYLNVETLNYVF